MPLHASVVLVAAQSRSLRTQSLQQFVHFRRTARRYVRLHSPGRAGAAPRRTTRNKNVVFQFGTGTGVGALAGGIPVTVRRGDSSYLLAVFSSTCHARRTLEPLTR